MQGKCASFIFSPEIIIIMMTLVHEYAMISCDLRGRENIAILWCSCHLVISLEAACSAGIYAEVCSFHPVLTWLEQSLFGLFSRLDIVQPPLGIEACDTCYFLYIAPIAFFTPTTALLICMNQGTFGRFINKDSFYLMTTLNDPVYFDVHRPQDV